MVQDKGWQHWCIIIITSDVSNNYVEGMLVCSRVGKDNLQTIQIAEA